MLTYALPLVDRKRELDQFRRILRGEADVRGLVIHSRGDRGWGKSALLEMFRQECEACESPTTSVFFFEPSDTGADWKSIMDHTTRALGTEHFPRYLSASASAYSREVRESPADYGEVRGRVEFIASDLRQGTGDIAGVMIKQSFLGIERPERLLMDITEVFLEELQALPEPAQIVWLVDSLDWIDRDTKAWLIKMFGRIASQRLTRIILVVAGRELLHYHPSWKGRVAEIDIRPFDEEDVMELFSEVGWVGDIALYELAAESLVAKCKGRPLDICTQIESRLSEWGDSDV